jgi:hypothetical protein
MATNEYTGSNPAFVGTAEPIPAAPSDFVGVTAGSSYNLMGGSTPNASPLGGNSDHTLASPNAALTAEANSQPMSMGVPSQQGLTNTQATALGTGIDMGTQIAGGLASNAATTNLQEASYMQGKDDLASYENEQRKNQKLDLEGQNKSDATQAFKNKANNAAFRQKMFQRDLQKELQQYNDAVSSIGTLQKMVNKDESFKDALLSLNRTRR